MSWLEQDYHYHSKLLALKNTVIRISHGAGENSPPPLPTSSPLDSMLLNVKELEGQIKTHDNIKMILGMFYLDKECKGTADLHNLPLEAECIELFANAGVIHQGQVSAQNMSQAINAKNQQIIDMEAKIKQLDTKRFVLLAEKVGLEESVKDRG
jgi:hypothetical protein